MNFFNNFQEHIQRPFIQAGVILCLVFCVNIFSLIIKSTELITVSDRFAWLNAASFMLFFAVLNSLYSLVSKSAAKYWGYSMYGFMLVAGLAGLQAFLFSGISIRNAGSYVWIYFVVSFGYLVFLSLMSVLKKVVSFAEKEEWNSPKMRPRR